VLHPHSDRLRMLEVEAAYSNLHTTSIEWMGAVMKMPQG
jgi:carbonic anhydrase